MNILIAEDDPVSSSILKKFLESLGHIVTATADGQKAWDAYQSQPCRLVITDWLMPNMDGVALTEKIRGVDRKDYTYVIMVTSNKPTLKNRNIAMNAGIDDFLTKPFDRNELDMRLKVAQRILKANSQIQSLESMLTICAYTKKIKFPDEGWQSIETFMSKHLGITLSHGIDPEHFEKVLMPELEALKSKHENEEE